MVGRGGFLIAATKTWGLVESHEWGAWVFWALVAVMACLNVGHPAARSARERALAEAHRAAT